MHEELEQRLPIPESTSGIITIGHGGQIVRVVGDVERLTAAQADTLIGTAVVDLLPDSFKDPFITGLRQFREGGESWLIGQLLALNPSSSENNKRSVALEFRVDSDQAPPGLSCVLHDQTTHEARLFQSALLIAQHQVSPDGIMIVSPRDEILFYNERFTEIWDVPQEVLASGCINEVRKVKATLVVDPEGIFYEGFQNYDGTRESSHDELKLRDGRTLVRHSAPAINDNGVLLGRFWSYRDVTEHRRMQYLLEQETRRLTALVDNNPDLVLSFDNNGEFVTANRSILHLLGYQPDEISGNQFETLISSEDQEEFRTRIISVRQGSSQEFELTVKHKSGEQIKLRMKLIPVSPGNDNTDYWAVATDVTEIRRTTAEAQKARVSLEAAQRMTGLGSFEWDAASDELRWSGGLYQIIGVGPEEFTATFEHFLQLVHPDDQDNLLAAVKQTLNTGKSYEMNLRIIRYDGSERTLHALGENVVDENGTSTGMAGTVLDITERRAAEEAMQHMVILLEEKTRALEATTSEQEAFINSASHDLRSPLISIQGLTEIILSDFAEDMDSEAKQHLNRISVNTHRLQDMLSGLLELSRIGRTEHDNRHEIDLHKIVVEIIDGLKETPRGHQAEFEIDGELPTVSAHPSRMAQLFMNVLDNALKYTPEDRIPRVVLRTVRDRDSWKISVTDNGIGIPADQQKSALLMFSRLPMGQRLNPGGSGLGLAIVSRIVATYGGNLTLESVEGEGTTISFTLE